MATAPPAVAIGAPAVAAAQPPGVKERGKASATRADLPPIEEWPQRPLYVRWAPWCAGGPPGGECLRVNSRGFYEFETELFKGSVHIAVRDAKVQDKSLELDPWAPGERWCTKKRRFVCSVTGHFKKQLPMDQVELGILFERPVNPPKGMALGTSILERFSPGMRSDFNAESEAPYLMNNLCCAGADTLSMQYDDDPDPPFDPSNPGPLAEKLRVKGQGDIPFVKKANARMRWMSQSGKDGRQNCSRLYYDTEALYTFDFYTHTLHMDKFEGWFPLGFTAWVWDLSEYFAGQPWPIVFRLKSGEVLGALEVWHERTARRSPPTVFRPPAQPITFAYMMGHGDQPPGAAATPEKKAMHHDPSATPRPRTPPHRSDSHSRNTPASACVASASPRSAHRGDDKDLLTCVHWEDDESDSTESDAGLSDEDGPVEPGKASQEHHDGAGGDSGDSEGEGQSGLETRECTGLGHSFGSAQANIEIVLWHGKRLRSDRKQKRSWVPGGRLPQGMPVMVKEKCGQGRSGWSHVVLAGGEQGWLRSRNLAPRPSAEAMTGLTPAIVTAGHKRLRRQGLDKAKFMAHRPRHIPAQSRVFVLSLTPSWALVMLPESGTAGWLRRRHLQLDASAPPEAVQNLYDASIRRSAGGGGAGAPLVNKVDSRGAVPAEPDDPPRRRMACCGMQ